MGSNKQELRHPLLSERYKQSTVEYTHTLKLRQIAMLFTNKFIKIFLKTEHVHTSKQVADSFFTKPLTSDNLNRLLDKMDLIDIQHSALRGSKYYAAWILRPRIASIGGQFIAVVIQPLLMAFILLYLLDFFLCFIFIFFVSIALYTNIVMYIFIGAFWLSDLK